MRRHLAAGSIIAVVVFIAGCRIAAQQSGAAPAASPAGTATSVSHRLADLPTPTNVPIPIRTRIPLPADSPVDWVLTIVGDPYRLYRPVQIAADDRGNLYVVDGRNDRVQKFDSEGRFVTTWGRCGDADGEFEFWCHNDEHLGGIAVDSQGHVDVVDGTGRVQIFDASGRFLGKWGSKGSGPGQLNGPAWMAVDHQGNVLVADFWSNRVAKFGHDGTFITQWGTLGTATGEFEGPIGVAVDSQDNVYVADCHNLRIQKFDNTGRFLLAFGGEGTGDGQFEGCVGVAVGRRDHVYVTDNRNSRVEEFDDTGRFLAKWGTKGNGDGQFGYTAGIAADKQGNVYVTDVTVNWPGDGVDRVQKFRPR